MTVGGGKHEGTVAEAVGGSDVGAMGQQQLQAADVAGCSCSMQWRVAVAVPLGEVGRREGGEEGGEEGSVARGGRSMEGEGGGRG